MEVCSVGKVISVDGDIVRISVPRHASCSGCAENNCTFREVRREKGNFVVAALSVKDGELKERKFEEGESVRVLLPRVRMLTAVLLAFILPSLLIIGCVWLCTAMDVATLTGGCLSLAVLSAYVLLLKMNEKHLKRYFNMTIVKEKISTLAYSVEKKTE